jgi:hypothetical protein
LSGETVAVLAIRGTLLFDWTIDMRRACQHEPQRHEEHGDRRPESSSKKKSLLYDLCDSAVDLEHRPDELTLSRAVDRHAFARAGDLV